MSKIYKNSLENLLGSKLRVKVLKYLFRNYPDAFTVRGVSRVIQEPILEVTKELTLLKTLGLIMKKK